MRLKAASALALAVMASVIFLSPGLHSAPVARADGPVGWVDPIGGSIAQTYTFTFQGFQPYTQLTLSFLQPGATAFTIVDTPVPVITDGYGQAQFPISLLSLLGDPSQILAMAPGASLAQLGSLAGLLNVTWGPAPAGAIASFRADACDTVNCVDMVGTLVLAGR